MLEYNEVFFEVTLKLLFVNICVLSLLLIITLPLSANKFILALVDSTVESFDDVKWIELFAFTFKSYVLLIVFFLMVIFATVKLVVKVPT